MREEKAREKEGGIEGPGAVLNRNLEGGGGGGGGFGRLNQILTLFKTY